MKQRFFLISIMAFFLLLVFEPVKSSSKEASLSVIDDTGQRVQLKYRSMRIVSLAPNMTEIVYAIGVGGRVVGVSDLCDFPSEVRNKPHVGDLQLRTESVMALKPDLVLAHAGMQRAQIQELRRLGLNVAAFAPENWQSVLRVIREVGVLTGRPEAARRVVESMEERKRKVIEQVKGRLRARVFVEVWNAPLMTAGPGTFLDQLLTMAGGTNIAGKGHAAWAAFPQELVLERDPEVIILTCKNKADVMARRGWGQISAVRSGRVYEVEPDIFSRPGPRLVEALEVLARLLQPDR